MKRYRVLLNERERAELLQATRKGLHPAQVVINALILLNCDEGALNERKHRGATVADVLRISLRKVDRVKRRFVEGGLHAALGSRQTRPAGSRKTNDELEARLLALSRSAPPRGRHRWSLRLLAEQAVERNYADSLSHETVRQILKHAGASLNSA